MEKNIYACLESFQTLLDKWGHPQPGKPSIPSRRPLSVQLLPWIYHGNSYWRDRANRNRPKVQERTLRHRSNELCRVVWRAHWPFMQKHLVRPQFATGFQKAPFGRRTICLFHVPQGLSRSTLDYVKALLQVHMLGFRWNPEGCLRCVKIMSLWRLKRSIEYWVFFSHLFILFLYSWTYLSRSHSESRVVFWATGDRLFLKKWGRGWER